MRFSNFLIGLFGILVGAILVGGVSWALAQSGYDYHACVNNSSGTIHMTTEMEGCNNNEELVSWSKEGPPGPAGSQGLPGASGSDGVDGNDGLHCWDLNGNGVGDLSDEDTNNDTVVDVLDCKGPPGPQGPQGDPGSGGSSSFQSFEIFLTGTETKNIVTHGPLKLDAKCTANYNGSDDTLFDLLVTAPKGTWLDTNDVLHGDISNAAFYGLLSNYSYISHGRDLVGNVDDLPLTMLAPSGEHLSLDLDITYFAVNVKGVDCYAKGVVYAN